MHTKRNKLVDNFYNRYFYLNKYGCYTRRQSLLHFNHVTLSILDPLLYIPCNKQGGG